MITFTSVFVILFFIFILQGIWLFISDLAGKDLDTFTIVKFLSFYAPTVVPLVLPLSILLAGIMTFGSLAENYEFAAMKSSGISLQRAMKTLSLAILLLSFVTFFFANNVIPESQFRFLNLRNDIVRLKPAMAIAKGQFNTIGNINIKVDDKSGNNGQFLTNVTMHIKNSKTNSGANTVIKAKRGILKNNTQPNILQLELLDGNYYENVVPKDFNERKKVPFVKSSFQKYIVNIDLSKLNKTNENADENITTEKMLNIGQLDYAIDSLQKKYNQEVLSYSDNAVVRYNNILNDKKKLVALEANSKYLLADTLIKKQKITEQPHLLDYAITKTAKRKVLELAKNNINSTLSTINMAQNDLEYKQKNINSHWIVYHEKFMIAYACLLMFFIGAPLGAIIRKGGLGLPMVFAVIIFIAFHFMNVFGRKLAEENAVHPAFGVWLSSIVLTPLAIWLTYNATNDIDISFNFDWLMNFFKKIFRKIDVITSKPIVSLHNLTIDLNDHEYASLHQKETTVLKNIVKNADQFEHSEEYRLKTLKMLESRGIDQEQLRLENSLYNKNYLELKSNVENFKFQSKVNLVFYTLLFGLIAFVSTSQNIIVIFVALLLLGLFYTFIFRASTYLKEISKLTNYNGFITPLSELLIGFPFYIFTFLYNNSKLKELLSNYNN